ncbi:MAG: DMT family transporter [Pseudomonadota bacterium]
MARLILLTALTMAAFAANSLLNRAALLDGGTGPAAFAALRLVSGAACLALLVALRRETPKTRVLSRDRWIGAAALAVYMLGFSFAYVSMDAGIGALILFGMVQVTMFSGGILGGERPAAGRWLGTGFALVGLAWLAWPGVDQALPLIATALMISAAVGWGIYSLVGRRAADPLRETASNFLVASPVAVVIWLIFRDSLDAQGAMLAIVSGAITSGCGYALWYAVLPRVDASVAALSQLTVPVIAVLGGALFLAETPSLRVVLASAVILGGVAFGILSQRKSGSSGS